MLGGVSQNNFKKPNLLTSDLAQGYWETCSRLSGRIRVRARGHTQTVTVSVGFSRVRLTSE